MTGSHMWVKQTLPTTVFVPSWFISGRPGMLFLPCSPGRRLFSCVLLILTPAHTHLRLIIADGSWQYLRPCWRSVPHWIVVLTSVSVAWLAFVLLCVPLGFFWPRFPSTCIDCPGPDQNESGSRCWIGRCVYLVLYSTKKCLTCVSPDPLLESPEHCRSVCINISLVLYINPLLTAQFTVLSLSPASVTVTCSNSQWDDSWEHNTKFVFTVAYPWQCVKLRGELHHKNVINQAQKMMNMCN